LLLAVAMCGCASQVGLPAGGPTLGAASSKAASPTALSPQAAVHLADLSPAVGRPAGKAIEGPSNEQAAALLTEARALQEKGDFTGALSALEKAQGQEGQSLAVQRQLAVSYAAMGNWAKARVPLEKVAAQAGDDVEIQCLLGRMAVADGRLEAATTSFRTALVCSDASDGSVSTNQCLVRLGSLLARRGFLTASLDCYKRLAANLEAHGRELSHSSDLGVVIRQPEMLLCRQGRLLMRLGRCQEAAELGDMAYRLNKTYAPAMSLMVESLVAGRAYDKAESALLELMYGPAPAGQIRQLIETVYRAKNDPAGLERLWLAYQAGTPNPPPRPVLTLAQAAWEMGARDRAVAVLQQYCQAAQGESETAAQLAQWLVICGDVPGALDVLASLIAQDASATDVVEQRINAIPAGAILENLVRDRAARADENASDRKFALHYVAALLARRASFNDLARQELLGTVSAEPEFQPGHSALVSYLIDQHAFDRANEAAAAAQAATKKEYFGRYLAGWVLLAQGKNVDAIKCLQKSIELQPDYAPSRRLIAQAYLRDRQAGQAEHHLLHAFRELQDLQAGEALVHMYFEMISAAHGSDAQRQRTNWLLRARQTVEAMVQMDADSPRSLRMLASFQHVSGQTLQARRTLTRLMAVAGDDVDVRLLKVVLESRSALSGDNRMSDGRFGHASEDLRFVLSRQPDNAEAQMLLARVYMARDDYAGASAILAKMHQARPADMAVALFYSLALSRAGQAVQAADLLQDYAAQLKQDDSLWVLTIVLGDAGRHDHAIELLRSRADHGDSAAAALADRQILVHVLGRAHQLNAALELADKMVDPNVPLSVDAAAIARIDVLAEAGRWADMKAAAVRWLDQSDLARWTVERDEQAPPRMLHRLAIQMASLRGRSEARAWRLLVTAADPVDLAVAYLLRAGRPAEAERFALQQINRLQSAGGQKAALAATLRAGLVARLHVSGYGQRASDRFEQFVKADPNNHALLVLGQSVLDSSSPSQRDRVVTMLTKALEQTPGKSDILNNLGYTLADAGIRLDEAEGYLRQALAENVETNTQDSIGWLKYKQGQFVAALEYVLLALNHEDGDNPVVYDHAGDTFWRLGRAEEAAAMWAEAADLAAAELQERGKLADSDTRRTAAAAAEKLRAVQHGRTPGVAPVGQGIVPAAPPVLDESDVVWTQP
jgi:tetratricopeptide (TPR) repeat protein